MTVARLFEDDITPDANMSVDHCAMDESTQQYRGRVLGGLAVVAIILTLWISHRWDWKPRSLMISGTQVGQLQLGAGIMLDGKPVGKVENVEVRNGVPSARLAIDPQYLERISGSSRFEVASLNRILPGNVGVKISSGGLAATNAVPAGDLQAIHDRLADNSILPAHTPLGFYLVLIVLVVLGVLLLRLVFKVIKSTWSVVAVVLVIVALHSCYTGNLNLNQMAHWAYERAKAVETRAEPLDRELR